MARRSDPQRIFTARRMAVRNVLASDGTPEATAEAWCDAWQDEGERLGLDPSRLSTGHWDWRGSTSSARRGSCPY